MLSVEDLKARYQKTEHETDGLGRTFVVGMLKPAQRMRVFELTDSVSGLVLLPMLRAASVRKMSDPSGKEILFSAPNTRADIDIVLDVLDVEGMEAVAKALSRLDPPKDDGRPKVTEDEAKN